jgi:predicted enzyme related to lactoylglutathione lyase
MKIGEHGTMMFFLDPQGAAVGVWQAGTHRGAGLVNKPNSLCWNELFSRDVEASKNFYAKVFGYTYDAMPMGDFEYNVIKVGERPNGGIMRFPPELPESMPPHWMVYFAVADTDAIVRKCEELGGKVHMPATDMPFGRFAVLADSQGAVFTVLRLNQE